MTLELHNALYICGRKLRALMHSLHTRSLEEKLTAIYKAVDSGSDPGKLIGELVIEVSKTRLAAQSAEQALIDVTSEYERWKGAK